VKRTARVRLGTQLPEAGRFWVRYAPRGWPGPRDRSWLDLAAGRLRGGEGRGARDAQASAARASGSRVSRVATSDAQEFGTIAPGAGLSGALVSPAGIAGQPGGASRVAADLEPGAEGEAPQISWAEGPPLDDVLYLPPVPRQLAAWRDRVAAEQLAAGTPLLVQLLPGDDLDLPVTSGGAVACAFDLTAALLAGELDRLSGVPGWALAVWPLLPGLTDEPALWEKGCRKLAAAGVQRVQALAPSLSPADRRRLAAGAPARVFEALFHGAAAGWAAERELARVAHRHGLAPFLPRPARRAARAPGNRAAAAALGLAAELWLRLGRAVEPAQALYRAARWVDGTSYDVEALAREGNLGVVVALDAASRRLLAEQAGGAEPALLRELLAEYLAAPERAASADAAGSAGAGSAGSVGAGSAGTADDAGAADGAGSAGTANDAGAADGAGSAGTANDAGAADGAGSAGTADDAGAADGAGSAGTADDAGAADGAGSAGMADDAGAADGAGSAGSAGTVGAAGSAGSADTAGAADTTDIAEERLRAPAAIER
jgi:hypothetical protein